jgi:hypothetical protein
VFPSVVVDDLLAASPAIAWKAAANSIHPQKATDLPLVSSSRPVIGSTNEEISHRKATGEDEDMSSP